MALNYAWIRRTEYEIWGEYFTPWPEPFPLTTENLAQVEHELLKQVYDRSLKEKVQAEVRHANKEFQAYREALTRYQREGR